MFKRPLRDIEGCSLCGRRTRHDCLTDGTSVIAWEHAGNRVVEAIKCKFRRLDLRFLLPFSKSLSSRIETYSWATVLLVRGCLDRRPAFTIRGRKLYIISQHVFAGHHEMELHRKLCLTKGQYFREGQKRWSKVNYIFRPKQERAKKGLVQTIHRYCFLGNHSQSAAKA